MTDTSQYDQHPIYLEFKRIAPEYEPSQTQGYRMLSSPDPAKDVGLIAKRVADVKAAASRYLGIPTSAITDADALGALWWFQGYGESRGEDEAITQRMGVKAMLEIGKRLSDPVRTMYHAILGREPDDAGYAFWNGHYQDGIPLSELCRYMEREKAAGAT